MANPFTYTGRELDEATGLYYYRARYYDAEVGRFLTRDILISRRSTESYLYADGNPMRFVDAFGLFGRDLSKDCPVGCCTTQLLDEGIDIAHEVIKQDRCFDLFVQNSVDWETMEAAFNGRVVAEPWYNKECSLPDWRTGRLPYGWSNPGKTPVDNTIHVCQKTCKGSGNLDAPTSTARTIVHEAFHIATGWGSDKEKDIEDLVEKCGLP